MEVESMIKNQGNPKMQEIVLRIGIIDFIYVQYK